MLVESILWCQASIQLDVGFLSQEPAERMLSFVLSCNWCPCQVTTIVGAQGSGNPFP